MYIIIIKWFYYYYSITVYIIKYIYIYYYITAFIHVRYISYASPISALEVDSLAVHLPLPGVLRFRERESATFADHPGEELQAMEP